MSAVALLGDDGREDDVAGIFHDWSSVVVASLGGLEAGGLGGLGGEPDLGDVGRRRLPGTW